MIYIINIGGEKIREYDRGEPIIIELTFTDSDGTLYDPTTVTLDVYDTLETKQLDSATPTKVSVGVYTYTYNIPTDAEPGLWRYVGTGTTGSSSVIEPDYFVVKSLGSMRFSDLLTVRRLSEIDETAKSDTELLSICFEVDQIIKSILEENNIDPTEFTTIDKRLSSAANFKSASMALMSVKRAGEGYSAVESSDKRIEMSTGEYGLEKTIKSFEEIAENLIRSYLLENTAIIGATILTTSAKIATYGIDDESFGV